MNSGPLFEPFTVKSLSLRNRFVMAPMARKRCPGGIPDENVAAYFRRRAEAGVSLVMTESTAIDRPAASDHVGLPNFREDSIPGWERVVQEVHRVGGNIALQLWHKGLERKPGTGPCPDAPSEGPSSDGVGRAMSERDIADTIAVYAAAAARARQIGFDAVEVHGAHGYLIDQFFRPQINRRTDAYGVSGENRTRFATEIVKAVRRSVGPDYPISFRFSQWQISNYQSRLAETPNELERFLLPFVDAGVDLLHASTRRFWVPEFPGSGLNLAGWAKTITGLPVITVGSVGLDGPDFASTISEGTSALSSLQKLDALEKRLSEGEFDLVAVGRALLADPQWVEKVRDGRSHELRAFDKAALAELY